MRCPCINPQSLKDNGIDSGSFSYSTDVLCESEHIRVSRMLTETDDMSPIASLRNDRRSPEASPESSPEYGSFNIILYKEIMKSHQVVPSSVLLPGEEVKTEDVEEQREESTVDVFPSLFLRAGAADHSASKTQQGHREETTEPQFHYQPQSTALTGSCVLFTRPLNELHAPPRLRPGGKGRPTHSSST